MFKAAIINIFITMRQMTMWKQCDSVKGVSSSDEPTQNYHLNVQLIV